MKQSPYKCHLFVCVNDRSGIRRACADGGSVMFRERLKKELLKIDPSKSMIRVSQSLCLGLCASGPNVLIYPQNILYANVKNDDLDDIIGKVKELITVK